MAATPPPGQGEGGVLWLAGPGSYTLPFPLSEGLINPHSVSVLRGRACWIAQAKARGWCLAKVVAWDLG